MSGKPPNGVNNKMVIKETIQIQLEMLTAKFTSQMNKARSKMSKLNKTLISQKEKYRRVNNEITSLSSRVSLFKKRTQALTKTQKGALKTVERDIAMNKQRRATISNSMNGTKQQQAVLANSMKDRSRLFKKKESEMKKNIKSTQGEATATKLSTMQNMNWRGIVNLSMGDYQTLAKSQKRISSTSGRAMMGMRNLTHGMKGFRMEALGVMFFGMAMQRMFAGFLKPVSEAFGITELFGDMLTVLFLPIMEEIFPALLKVAMWFMNLPDPVKKAIGVFVLVGMALGTILMILGTLALGLGSLILFWPLISGAAVSAMVGVALALAPIIGIIAIIVLIVVGMMIAWKENFLGMKKIVSFFFSGVKDIFMGLVSFISGIFLIIKGIFMGDWTMIWEGVKKIFWGALKAIWGIIKILIGGIGAIFVGLIRIVWSVIKLIIAPFVWLWNFLVGHSLIPDLINAIVDWFKKLPGKIWDVVKGIGKMIAKGFVNLLPDWIVDILKKGISFVGKIFNRGGSSKREDDFIWRPGQGSVSINPNDTLVGFKGSPPNLGGTSGGSTTNNFYGFTTDDLKRELDDRDRKMVSEMERNR